MLIQLEDDGEAETLTRLRLGMEIGSIPQSKPLMGLATETVGIVRQRVLTGDASLDNLAAVRAQVVQELGEPALVDACGVIGMFNGMNKVADMTGVRVDPTLFESRTWSAGYKAFVSSVALAIDALKLGELRKGNGVRLTSATGPESQRPLKQRVRAAPKF